MSHASLNEYMAELERDGRLVRVPLEVNRDLEVAEITRQAACQGASSEAQNAAGRTDREHLAGPAIHFQNIADACASLVTGLFATTDRLCHALAVDSLDQIADRIAAAVDLPRRSWFDRLSGASQADSLDRFRPKSVKTAACQQVVQLGGDIDLHQWPALKSWPEESARSLSGAPLISQNPESGERGVDRLTLPVLGRDQLAVFCDPYGPLATNLAKAKSLGEKLPVAVVLGGPPALTLAAEIPIPPVVDPLALAGLLREVAIESVRARSHDLDVPAEAEVVLEGYLDPAAPPVDAGRFVARTGFYQTFNPAYALYVTALTHRSEPVVPATITHPLGAAAASEIAALVQLRERLAAPMLRAAAPETVELHLPPASCGAVAIISLDKRQPYQARRLAGVAWALPSLEHVKVMILVDAHVDVFNLPQTLSQVAMHVHPELDATTQTGPAALWDQACRSTLAGQKLLLDATAKLPGERADQSGPPVAAQADPETREAVARRWAEYGLGAILEPIG